MCFEINDLKLSTLFSKVLSSVAVGRSQGIVLIMRGGGDNICRLRGAALVIQEGLGYSYENSFSLPARRKSSA
jgi:hypothetical protein